MIRKRQFDITEENVTKAVQQFRREDLPRLETLWKYYANQNAILTRKAGEKGAKNRIAHAYARYIVTQQAGYFMGIGIKHTSSEEAYLQEYKEILEQNFETDVNFELAKAASIFGFSAELIYQDEKSQTKFKKLDTREVIPIFGTSLGEFLLAVIRYYLVEEEGQIYEVAEVYDDRSIYVFERKKTEQIFRKLPEVKEHKFQEIPIILYKNNEEMSGDFEDVIGINDSYDTAQSNTANDVDYFNDAYLVIEGSNDLSDTEEDDGLSSSERTQKILKENKVMYFPDGGGAKFLVKDINDAATENYKSRLNSDIHKFAMTPDLTDEEFAGNLSGIAIRFKTIPLEQSATVKENKFRVGLRKRRQLITFILNTLKNRNYDYRDISEEFTRNLPQNEKEKTDTILSLAEYISRRTLLQLLPQIEDADEELRRLQQEQEEYNQLDYDFSRLAKKSDVIRDDEPGVLEN